MEFYSKNGPNSATACSLNSAITMTNCIIRVIKILVGKDCFLRVRQLNFRRCFRARGKCEANN